MIAEKTILERMAGRAKDLGIADGPIGVRAAMPEAFDRADDPSAPDRPDYIAIANTADIDLEDEVVIPSGANTQYIDRNKVMFSHHRYEPEHVVAKIRTLRAYPDRKNHKAWQVRFKLVETLAGQTARTLIDQLGGIGLSVGFVARDFGSPSKDEAKAYKQGDKTPRSVVRAWDMFEVSLTALPANVSCRTGAVAVDEKRFTEVENLIVKGRISRAGASMLGFPVEHRRKVWAVSDPSPRVWRAEGRVLHAD